MIILRIFLGKFKNKKMDHYNADFRVNNPIYLIRQAQELLIFAKANKNSNAIIYACLDSRIALELLDLNKVLLSVEPSVRLSILEDSKPKNGIDRNGKKTGSLKEKYQLFFQAVCEISEVDAKLYEFKKSKELQYKLSTYIHSYYMMPDEINFESALMQDTFTIISETHKFIKSSLHLDGDEYASYGINISSIPQEDKIILDEWKANEIDYDELKSRLINNKQQREKK